MASQPDSETLIAEGCFLVGHRDPNRLLQCNTYLRVFQGPSAQTVRWCVDPGSVLDYEQVKCNLLEHMESLRDLTLFSLNHQDPDVTGNLPALLRDNDALWGIVSEDTWRLACHLGGQPRELQFADPIRGSRFEFPSGNVVRTVPTPFCHFRGAVAFYDPESRVLFSGDLFGGLNDPGRIQLWGEEQDWPGIAIFHQIYMPTTKALAHAIRQIRALDPPIKIIAPQHGFALQGDFMYTVMERLESLPVGFDRLPGELDEAHLPAYSSVFDEVLEVAAKRLGRLEVLGRLKALPPGDALARAIRVGPQRAKLCSHGVETLALLVDVLGRGESIGFRQHLRHAILRGCQTREAPLPSIAPGMEEPLGGQWIG